MQKHTLNTNDQPHTELVFTLTTEPKFLGQNIQLEDQDLADFADVHGILKPIRKAYGSLIGIAYLDWPLIKIPFYVSSDACTSRPETIIEGLQVTANQLKQNSNLNKPLPIGNAVSCIANVSILRAISFHLTEVRFMSNDNTTLLPILDPMDFLEPETTDTNRKFGPLKITGLYRSEDIGIGHGLFLSHERIFVRLPANDPKWSWENIQHVLNEFSWLEGEIIRAKKGAEWMLAENAKIIGQEEFDFTHS